MHWHGGSGPATDLLLAAALPTRLLLTTLTAAAVPSTPIYKVRYSERCDAVGARHAKLCDVVGEQEEIKANDENEGRDTTTRATTIRERLRDGTDWRTGRPGGHAPLARRGRHLRARRPYNG